MGWGTRQEACGPFAAAGGLALSAQLQPRSQATNYSALLGMLAACWYVGCLESALIPSAAAASDPYHVPVPGEARLGMAAPGDCTAMRLPPANTPARQGRSSHALPWGSQGAGVCDGLPKQADVPSRSARCDCS